MESWRRQFLLFLMILVFSVVAPNAVAETLYVDSRNGSDKNPGTKEKPVRTMEQAAAIINGKIEPGPSRIKIAPGVYTLSRCVTFENKRPYTGQQRLVIEASILPGDPEWRPALMPIVLSTEDPREPGRLDRLTATYSVKIGISHVTIRGLKFFGNPLARNWHCCISRIGDKLEDLVVTQCMFVGDRDGLDIYCAALATGDKFMVEHSIFRDCHACVVFWDGLEGIPGRGNAMRCCIVDGAYIAGVWTCQTAEDLEFSHNIVTRSEYFWMRKSGDRQKYRLHECIVTDNKYYSGYGVENGPTGQTGPEVTYEEKDVLKKGEIALVKDKRARDYLHIVKGTFGSELGAGLFGK